jgi:hypothetical protein
MAGNPRKLPVSLVSSGITRIEPPRPLGLHGQALWTRIQAEYGIKDTGGIELLAQACAAVDRAEVLAAEIARDGAVIRSPTGAVKTHPSCRDELAARTFVVRTLEKLGVTTEPIKSPGRQPSFASYIPPGN